MADNSESDNSMHVIGILQVPILVKTGLFESQKEPALIQIGTDRKCLNADQTDSTDFNRT